MSKLYKSLMRGSEGVEVTWAMEWQKASNAQDELFAIVDGLPSVRSVARQLLNDELIRRRKSVDIDNVYINVENRWDFERRPSGTLSDVLFYCLDRDVELGYVTGGDGVFYLPDTFSDKFKVSGLGINELPDIIEETLRKLESRLRSELRKYWAAPVKNTAANKPVRTNKEAFQDAYASVMTAEFSLAVMASDLDSALARRFAYLLNAERGQGAYNVALNPTQDYLTLLGPSFVLDNGEGNDPEMRLNKDGTGFILHTPENGFEYFDSNIQLHDKLRANLALPDSTVSYLKTQQSVLSSLVEAHLSGQLDTLTKLLRDRGEQEQSLSSVLQENQNLHVLRYGISTRFYQLWVRLKRNDWPLWLVRANDSVQQRYTELEASRDQYEIEYQQAFDACFSLKDYVARVFSEWTMSALGEELDPNSIEVHSRYKMQVGGRTIEQEDNRTLTEFIIFGLHDPGYRAELRIVGAPQGTGLTVQKLENWLNYRHVRLDFVTDMPSVAPAEYRTAHHNHLISNMEYAIFNARHSGHFTDAEATVVERAMAGDPSILLMGVKLVSSYSALKDVLAFQARGSKAYYLFLRVPSGDFEFVKVADDYGLNKRLETALFSNREYAVSMIDPQDLREVSEVISGDGGAVNYRYRMDTSRVDLRLDPQAPLLSYSDVIYSAEKAMHRAIAPTTFQYAGPHMRQFYARLDTELKALTTVDIRENGFPSFEQFTRDYAKKKIEELLLTRGERVDVEPDHILVQTSEYRKSITDILIEGLTFQGSSASTASDTDARFYLTNNHPEMLRLDIRDLAAISRTRPGDFYTQMLTDDFLDWTGPTYEFKRAAYAKKVRCELYYRALAQYFGGGLPEQYLASIRRIIDGLNEKEGYDAPPHHLREGDEGLYAFSLLNNRLVEGVYIFRFVGSGVYVNYLYTPDAPDGVCFRPVTEFINSIRFRLGPFRDYYFSRILIEDQKVVDDYFDSLVATLDVREPIKTRGANKILNLYVLHDNKINRVLSDIDERTTSLNEVIFGLVYDSVLKGLNVISLVVPPVGTIVVAIQLMKSIYDGTEAYRRGDYETALGHGAEALVGLFTLGKAGAAAAAPAAANITNAQRSFLSLVQDARSAAQFVAETVGLKTADDELIEFFKELMKDPRTILSKTTVV